MKLKLKNDDGYVLAEFESSSSVALAFKFNEWLDRVDELGLILECTAK